MRTILSRKIVWTMIFCLLSFVLFNLVSYALGLAFWQPDNEDSFNIYLLRHSKKRYDIIFMGSSRIQFGIVPSVVEKELFELTGRSFDVFNIGQSMTGVRCSRTILRDVLKSERRPRMVVLGVNAGAFNSIYPFFNNKFYRFYASKLDILLSLDKSVFVGGFKPRVRGLLRDSSNLMGLVTRSPLHPSYREKLALIAADKGAKFPYGERSLATSFDESEKAKKLLSSLNREKAFLSDFEIEGPSDAAFKDVISLCSQRGIRLVVLGMPIQPDFLEDRDIADIHATFTEYITGACRQANIPFFNLQEETALLDERNFGDYDHFNGRGAEVASKFIAEKILIHEVEQL